MVKKICISSILLIIIILTVACNTGSDKSENQEYLRIHIRANSNEEADQNVKYLVRDAVVEYLTPIVSDCRTKKEATEKIGSAKKTLEFIIDGILKTNGFKYSSSVSVRNEQFPTRVYDDLTLSGGYYDAVIVELGTAAGDNWWCVVYPPLCFSSTENLRYASKIKEIIEQFKQKFFCRASDLGREWRSYL